MNVFLKVKICSLAAESKIIRREEIKAKRRKLGGVGASLHDHRIFAVRPETRAANLAYGFLRGRPYLRVENKTYRLPDWEKVERLILKFGEGKPQDLKQSFAEWKEHCVPAGAG